MIKRILPAGRTRCLFSRAPNTFARRFCTQAPNSEAKGGQLYKFDTLYKLGYDFEDSLNVTKFMAGSITIMSGLLLMTAHVGSGILMTTLATQLFAQYRRIQSTIQNSVERISYDKESQLLKFKLLNSDLELTKPIDEVYFSGFYKPLLFANAVCDVKMFEGTFHVFVFQGLTSIKDEKEFIEMVKSTSEPIIEAEEN